MKTISKELVLKIILVVSLAGLLFSGYLSFGELFKEACPIDGGCDYLAGIPTCVYGFFMYLIIFVLSILGLRSRK